MLRGPLLRERPEGTRDNLDEAKTTLEKTQSELNVEHKVHEIQSKNTEEN